MIGKPEVVTDLMQGDLRGSVNKQFIRLFRIYSIHTELSCGDHGNIILGVFPSEYGIIKVIVTVCG